MKNILIILVLVIIASGCSTQIQKRIKSRNGAELDGIVLLREDGNDVRILGQLTGFEPNGLFGFHIHERADCSGPDFKAAGGHYAPVGHKHGYPDSKLSHKGDLGNIQSNSEGVVKLDRVVASTSLTKGHNTLRGRALIIHAEADDYTTQPSGASGPRIGCVAIK